MRACGGFSNMARPFSAFVAVSAFVVMLAGPLGGADDALPNESTTENKAEEAGRQLLLLQAKIRTLKGDHARARKEKQDRLRELVTEERAVSRPLRSLEERIRKIREKIESEKAKLTKQEKELAAKKSLSGELKSRMKSYLDMVRAHVDAGIPWKQSFRRDSIQQAAAIVEDEKTALFPSLAAVGRVHQEEEALGRLVELSTIEVPYAGKKLALQGFHLGRLAVIYANEEGSILGFVQAGQEIREGIEAVEKTPLAQEGYLTAVDILRRRRTPGIVDLYLPALPMRKGDQ